MLQRDLAIHNDYEFFPLGYGQKAAITLQNRLLIGNIEGRVALAGRAELPTHLMLHVAMEIVLVRIVINPSIYT